VRKLIKPKVTERFYGSKPKRSKAWKHLTLYNDKIDSQLEACFLNHTKKLNLPADWNNESLSKLWVYNLHYFEDLLSHNAEEKRNFHLQLLANWVDENPVGYGVGWEPYPVSLRIVNILKAWLGGLELDKYIFKSIFQQASFLSNDLERHLLANHYFVNLKALLFAGIIFNNRDWIKTADQGLVAEIPEQILKDGAHCELSPMYHALILVDMLDILNLCRAYPLEVSKSLESLLLQNIPNMIEFMESMAHPDEGVSFFNDSVDGIAPAKSIIENYASQLEVTSFASQFDSFKVFDNKDSGYISAQGQLSKLIFDASPVGYPFNPGHAHADTLSFELSIGTTRVFVNSGISEYELGQQRISQRKTMSHNTVEVDDRDSSDVWSAFRVGNRAKVTGRSVSQSENGVHLTATHNGYVNVFGGCLVTRSLDYSSNGLRIHDFVNGMYTKAISRLHFHPDLSIELDGCKLMVTSPDFFMTCDLEGATFSLSEGFYSPGFGLLEKTTVLQTQILEGYQELNFRWSISH